MPSLTLAVAPAAAAPARRRGSRGVAARRSAAAGPRAAASDGKNAGGPAGGGPPDDDAEAVTRKFGLEAGLWKVFTAKDNGSPSGGDDKGNQAKELLKRYGSAYLITSISLSAVSFGICYALVTSGIDVGPLLQKIGIEDNTTSETAGTFALAYAAHKALSPVRFPPTVALTPLLAQWMGGKGKGGE